MQAPHLEQIKSAQLKISPYIRKTPLLPFDYLSLTTGKEIQLKCETFQKTGSFKIRGAANCILENLPQAKRAGVIAASAGNHAQGVAAICKFLGIRSTIVMPESTPPIKVRNTQGWGAEVQLFGKVYDDAFDHAIKLASSKGHVFIHPFRDTFVMAGQGTIALELTDDKAFGSVEAVVISVGGGGLITGCATVLKALRPDIKIYGVAAKNAPSTWKSFHEGSVIEEQVSHTLAEGVAAKKTDPQMLGFLKDHLTDFLALGEESIAHAISVLAEHGKMIVEGAGALPVAAILEGLIPEKRVTLILSGGNIDIPALSHVLHRGLVEQGRLIRLVVTVPDRPGGLHSYSQVLADKVANILQVFHRRSTAHTAIGEADVELDLETRGRDHTDEIITALKEHAFKIEALRTP